MENDGLSYPSIGKVNEGIMADLSSLQYSSVDDAVQFIFKVHCC